MAKRGKSHSPAQRRPSGHWIKSTRPRRRTSTAASETFSNLRPRLGTRDLVLQPALPGTTELRNRASIAAGRPSAADFAAQFHQGLVEAADVARGQHGLGRRPKQFLAGRRRGLAVVGQQPAEDPHGIGLQDRPPLVEGDGEDRPRRVAADARQPLDGLRIGGKAAVVFGDDSPGRLMKLPCAAIVAQSFPEAQDLLLIGFRQGAESWARRPGNAGSTA